MSEEYTTREVRDRFLKQATSIANYWAKQAKTTEEAAHGTLFSLLSMIDGCSMALPAFILAPYPDKSDKEYAIENGEDYYPYNDPDNVKCDIAGSLHELLHKYK